jgi:nuclear pore complex protein Nup133
VQQSDALETFANKRLDEDPFARILWPKKIQSVLGAGGTHGELCVRFASEDIREPIIKDNLLDDDVLREHIEKNRFEEWFIAACRTGKKAYEMEKRELMTASQQQAQPVEVDDEDLDQTNADDEIIVTTEEEIEVVEDVAEQDEDVDMQDS